MNKCKYIAIRTKNYEKYFYCRLNKKIINYTTKCIKCVKNEPRVNKPINKKTNKLKQKEQNRKSILTNNLSKCYICGKPKQDIHEVYSGSNRQTSIKWNCTIPICRICHTEWDRNKEMRQKYYDECRNKFVELYSYDLFMQEFKKSYKGE